VRIGIRELRIVRLGIRELPIGNCIKTSLQLATEEDDSDDLNISTCLDLVYSQLEMSPAILTSSSRVFPTEPSSARTTALSILDASVGNFSATAAAWVYDAPIGQGETAMTPANLKLSLATTLNAYPQWAGQLQYTTYLHDGNHTSRSRRLEVTYGAHADPGVEYVVASSSIDVAELFPSLEERTSGRGAFDASSLGALNFLPNSPALASQSSGDMDFAGLPCLIV
jgi:hypothetical protein